jgi:hypothetical protein
LVALAAFEAEITFLLAGRQEQIRARSERALLHLQRILAVDPDVSAKWMEAFNTNEMACERLGSVHLLSHGIYAFKVDAAGARTDLVFNEPPPDALLTQAVEGMVLTEWKIAKDAKHLEWRRRETWRLEAVLLERRLLNGKPAMQIVCALAAINEDEAHADGAIEAREAFWHDAAARIGRLHRLTDRDLDEIEACLAKRIGPRPLPAVQIGKVQAAE